MKNRKTKEPCLKEDIRLMTAAIMQLQSEYFRKQFAWVKKSN